MAEVDWIREIQARGWGDVLSAALDILEPLGPLGAQMLWIAQPAAHLIGGWGDRLGALAQMLEEPGGVERLRQMLEDENHTGDQGNA